MSDDVTPIPVNSPWERAPTCACDPGKGPIPTRQQRLECKLRGGPCREDGAADHPTGE